MILQNATRNLNQTIRKIENYYFNNETHYNQEILKERWSLYTEIFKQLNLLNKNSYLQEAEYRIVWENENINTVLRDLINGDDELFMILYPFTYVLEDFSDFDDIKIFL